MMAVRGRQRARGRGKARGAVDKRIMEKSAKSQGNKLSYLAKITLHQHLSIPPPTRLFLSLYERLSHIQAPSFTSIEMPQK